jgi:hypothetical protein
MCSHPSLESPRFLDPEIRYKEYRCLRSTGFTWLESSVEEEVMYCFPVFKQNHPKIAVLSLWNTGPTPDTAIFLDRFMLRAPHYTLNPIDAEPRAIWTDSGRFETSSGLHDFRFRAT